jgi:transposase
MGYYCGIDLGNKESVVCIISERRQVVAEVQVATKALEIRKVLRKYRELTCVIEAAPLAEWLCTEVEALGHKTSIVCPRRARVALTSQGKGKKTDRRDARPDFDG